MFLWVAHNIMNKLFKKIDQLQDTVRTRNGSQKDFAAPVRLALIKDFFLLTILGKS